MMEIKNRKELILYLNKLSHAYRKSYKLYGFLSAMFQITGGVLGSTAILASIPVIPVFISLVSAIPIIINIIINVTKLTDKKLLLKNHFRKVNIILTHVIADTKTPDDKIIVEVLKELNDLKLSVDYIEPLERYIKKFKLHEYDKETEESFTFRL